MGGLFRVYYVDSATAQEHNVFFVPEAMFLTSLKGLLTREVCPYYIAALLIISIDQLQRLYGQSHGWERFGCLLAEQYLVFHQSKSESLLLQTAE